jgi:hypothetical protein
MLKSCDDTDDDVICSKIKDNIDCNDNESYENSDIYMSNSDDSTLTYTTDELKKFINRDYDSDDKCLDIIYCSIL